MNLVLLLEERSMAAFLNELLPRVLPEGVTFQLIPHEGKSDLEKSIPRKLKVWRTPNTRFVVVRDQDSADCKVLKQKLVSLCMQSGRADTLVRIACHELEAWFLGDMVAVSEAFASPTLARHQGVGHCATPDHIGSPSEHLATLVPRYQKVDGARRIGARFDPARCQSPSFQAFLSGLLRLATG